MEKNIITRTKINIAVLFGILFLLNIYDGYSTTVLLKVGAEELNPIMAAAMERIGVMPAIIIIKTSLFVFLAGLVLFIKTNREHFIMTAGLLFLIGWYGAIMLFINYRLMAGIN